MTDPEPIAPGQSARPASLGPAAALAAVCTLAFLHARSYWVNVDDAYIAFRYAKNFAEGLGLVFNPGERVEGYTDFLWVIVLAAGHRLGLSIPILAQWLGLAATLGTIILTFGFAKRLLGLSPWAALLPAGVVAGSAQTAMWTGGGLETSLFMLLVTGALGSLVRDLQNGLPRMRTGLLLGLAALCRPEAAGLFAVAAGSMFLLRLAPLKGLVRFALGFAAVFAPHFAFRLLYYGDPLPNTFYAKTEMSKGLLLDGLSYTWEFLLAHGIWAIPAAILLPFLAGGTRGRRLAVPCLVIAAALAYIVTVGGDIYPYGRFGVPYLPWLMLLVTAGLLAAAERLRPGKVVFAAATAAAVMSTVMISAKLVPDNRHRASYEAKLRGTAPLMESYGHWLKDHYPAGTWTAISSLGRVPYYSELPTIDMLGLADRHIARAKVDMKRGYLGHQKYDSAYILRRAPQLVLLEFAGADRSFSPQRDLYTQKVLENIMPERGWWPAPSDLVSRKEFKRMYEPRAAEVQPGFFFFFFERSLRLENLVQQVADNDPNPANHFVLGMQYRLQGLYEEAVMALERASRLDPKAVDLKMNIGFFLLEAEQYQAAETYFRRLWEQEALRDSRAAYGAALSLHRQGKLGEAVTWWQVYLEQATPGDPFLPKAERFLAEAQHHQGH